MEGFMEVVLDTGALLSPGLVPTSGMGLFTVEECLEEVRDRAARERLTTMALLADVRTREPSREAVEAVVAFAKRTGDIAVLSKTDIKIMALAYTLEVERNGTKFIRFPAEAKKEVKVEEKTVMKVDVASVAKPGVSWSSVVAPSSSVAEQPPPLVEKMTEEEEGMWDEEDAAGVLGEVLDDARMKMKDGNDHDKALQESLEHWPVLPATKQVASAVTIKKEPVAPAKTWGPKANIVEPLPSTVPPPSAEQEQSEPKRVTTSRILSAASSAIIINDDLVRDTPGDSELQDDDGYEWASPGNYLNATAGWEIREGDGSVHSPSQKQPKSASVACATSDFAMQNVLLQMRLPVIAPADGKRITTLRNWVLKCDGCFQMCHDLTKKFCPSCGGHTLARLAYTIDKKGRIRYHYKKNRVISTRGVKYSISSSSNLLLREDQLYSGIWGQRAKQKTASTSMFGELVAESFGLSASSSSAGGNAVRFGHGSKNPNAQKGRERRGKGKSKQ